MNAEDTAATASPPTLPSLVLIAEDEEPIALALSYIVEDAGYRPLIAANGQVALEMARMHRPHLIITDLMMPRMSGRELLAALRQDPDVTSRAPVILMTAAGKAYVTDIEVDAILPKPFDITAVEALLHRFLG
jgi:CheY-like chemotaxis protein